VVGIHLLDFDLFEAPGQQDQAVWCFEMRDRRQPQVKLGNEPLVLARLLNKRFGPLSEDMSRRLNNATGEQLELWTDAVLDAPTLAAVFASH